MQEPLLSGSPSGKRFGMAGKLSSLLGQSIIQKTNIKNELPKVKRLPISLNKNFVETSVSGVDYKSNKVYYDSLWDTENEPRQTDPRKIFDGKRSLESELMPESNLISTGILVEKDGVVYIGTTYGKMKAYSRITKSVIKAFEVEESPKSPVKRTQTYEVAVNSYTGVYTFFNQGQREIKTMQIHQNFLVVQDATDSIFIYDIANQFEQPRQIDCFEAKEIEDLDITDIQCFEFKIKEEEAYITICYLDKIVFLKQGEDLVFEKFKTINIDIHISQILTQDDNQIFFADDQCNLFSGKIDGETLFDVKNLRLGKPGLSVQYLYYKAPILTVVISNILEKQTIIFTIDFTLLAQEENDEEIKAEKEKARKEEIERNRLAMTEDDFLKWTLEEKKKEEQELLQKQQQEEEEEEERLKRKVEDEEEVKMKGKHEKVFNIGVCAGVDRRGSQYLLLSGKEKFLILSGERWQKTLFDVITDFKLIKAQFTQNMKYIIACGTDGILREYQWRGEKNQSSGYLREANIEDAVSSGNGTFFALLSNEQTEVCVYSYETCQVLTQINDLKWAYLLTFTPDSKHLLIVQGTEDAKNFRILIYKVSKKKEKIQIVGRYKVVIEEDYITQIQAQVEMGILYFIGKANKQISLYVYDFNNQRVTLKQRDVTCLSMTTDGQLLAFGNKSSQIQMTFINIHKQRKAIKSTRKSSIVDAIRRKSVRASWKQKGNTIRSINTIQMKDEVAQCIEFYDKNKKLVIQTNRTIYGYCVLTHDELYAIQITQTTNELRKVRVQFDTSVSFLDINNKIYSYDVNYQLDPDYVNLISKPIQSFKLKVNEKHEINHSAWTAAGAHFIIQMEDNEILFARNPFLHHRVNNELVHSGPFNKIEGYFVPTFMGFRRMGVGSFGSIYEFAIDNEDKVDVDALRIPIYPYKLNAMHYFAMTGNVRGIEICFHYKINFIQDEFGKTPLDYAIESKDKVIIEAVLQGIFDSKSKARTKILRQLRLNVLLSNPNLIVANILSNYGCSEPETVKFYKPLEIPKLFPLDDNRYAESGLPVYSAEVAQQLHPPKLAESRKSLRPTSTIVLNNPLPNNFSYDSLELLKSIAECSIDEIVRTTPITLFLNRKWNAYGFNFYLFQFLLLTAMLVSLTLFDYNQDLPDGDKLPVMGIPCFIILIIGNHYFAIFEILQLAINGLSYFKSFANLLDLTRLTLLFGYIYNVFEPETERKLILPVVFLLLWYKVLQYLSVFKATRYLIKMIFEILRDVKTFMIVLFTVVLAYAQIQYAMFDKSELGAVDENGDVVTEGNVIDGIVRGSYTITLGELGDFDQVPAINFMIFVFFSFLIPLVLMNMIIALMGDSYARVQTNAIAADARALAEMLYELEEVVNSLMRVLKPKMLKNEYYFCFQTQINDADGEEDWEGTVGQLKRTIGEATTELQAQLTTTLTNFIEDNSKKNTEKIVERVQDSNMSELNIMARVQKMITRETTDIRDLLQAKMLEESIKTKQHFESNKQYLEQQEKKYTQEFVQTQKSIQDENLKIQEGLLKTQQKLESDSSVIMQQFQATQDRMKEESKQMQQYVENAYKLIEQQFETKSQTTQDLIKKFKKKTKNRNETLKTELQKNQGIINESFSNVKSAIEKEQENYQIMKRNEENIALLHDIMEQKHNYLADVVGDIQKMQKLLLDKSGIQADIPQRTAPQTQAKPKPAETQSQPKKQNNNVASKEEEKKHSPVKKQSSTTGAGQAPKVEQPKIVPERTDEAPSEESKTQKEAPREETKAQKEAQAKKKRELDFQEKLEKWVEKTWKTYDKDGNGFLDKEECRAFIVDVLMKMKKIQKSEDLNDKEFEAYFKQFDKDGTGEITRDEIKEFVLSLIKK